VDLRPWSRPEVGPGPTGPGPAGRHRSSPQGILKFPSGGQTLRQLGARVADFHSSLERSRRALPMTETLLRLIAPAAMIGSMPPSSTPAIGYKMPAASGTAAVL
jgi:hypothetical protein